MSYCQQMICIPTLYQCVSKVKQKLSLKWCQAQTPGFHPCPIRQKERTDTLKLSSHLHVQATLCAYSCAHTQSINQSIKVIKIISHVYIKNILCLYGCTLDKINLIAYGLGTKQVGHSGGRKDSGSQEQEICLGRCNKTDTWYLSTGDQSHGRIQIKING